MSDDLMRNHRGEAIHAWWVPVAKFAPDGAGVPTLYGVDWGNSRLIEGNPNRVGLQLMKPVEMDGRLGTHLLATEAERNAHVRRFANDLVGGQQSEASAS